MLLCCFSRASRVFVTAGLASVLFLLLAFLTASSIASAPNAKIVRKLNLNDRLTVKGKACQPQVQSQADTKIVIRCVKNKAQSAEPNTPAAKITLALNAGDKLIVKRKACRLQVTLLSNTRVWIICDKGPLPPIVPDTTKPLSSDTTQYLESVSPDGATFTFSQATDQLNALQVGDIIVSHPTQTAPEGFLRKVSSVTNNAGQIVVQTETTTLKEAVKQGEFEVVSVLTESNVQKTEGVKGANWIRRPGTPQGFYIQLQDVVLYDHDGNENTQDDQITADGSIDIEPKLTVRSKILDPQTQDLIYFTVGTQETTDLKVQSKINILQIHPKKEIRRFYLTPITGWLGPVPVVLVPILKINVGFDGTIDIGVSTQVKQVAEFTAGARYNNGWSGISQSSKTFEYTAPTLFAGLDAKGYLEGEMSFSLYGLVDGVSITGRGYLKLEANTAENPWWKLYGGLEVPITAKLAIFDKNIAQYDVVSIGYKILLAQAETPPPISSVFDDFSAHNVGSAPTGWSLFGATEITPIVEEYGGIGPAYHVLSFPEVSWQYWDKWAIRDGTIAANSYLVQAKLRFLNSVADRAGLTIAWDRNTWNHIDIDPNVYWNDIEFHSSYGGSVNNIVPNIDIQANTDYWLRAFVEDLGTNAGKVTVYWSTDGSTFTKVMEVTDLSNVHGETGVHTAGPHLPHTHFDDFEVQSQ